MIHILLDVLNRILMMSRTLENVDNGKCLLSHILFRYTNQHRLKLSLLVEIPIIGVIMTSRMLIA